MTTFEVPASGFLDDFGVPVVFGSITTTGILDMPAVAIEGGMVISTDYKLTFETDTMPTVDSNLHLTVNGVYFRVRSVRQLSDGTFSEAFMEKV